MQDKQIISRGKPFLNAFKQGDPSLLTPETKKQAVTYFEEDLARLSDPIKKAEKIVDEPILVKIPKKEEVLIL